MTPELAELSRSIDPALLGRRIRNARVAAGMTQSQVAADDVTTAYISRIEDGQRRPDAQLLERMAGRMKSSLEELLLGVTPNEALALRVALDQAELQFASGNVDAALEAVQAVLTGLGSNREGDLAARARELHAYALEATGQLQEAILALEDIVSEPRADAHWLKALIALCRCYRDAGELDRSIAVGERATETIEALGIAGLTESIQLSITVAGAYIARGDVGHAMRICRRAMDDGEKYDSPTATASAYWNASIIESRRGEYESALEYGRKALAIFERDEDARNLARLRAEFANVQLRQDPPDPQGALDTIARADRESAWSSTSTYDTARALLTQARAYFLLGDLVRASEFVERSVDIAPADAPMAKASALALQGQVAVAEGRHDQGQQRYRDAVLLLSGIGADREAAQLWFELGGLLSEVGDTQNAMEAFRRAAASTGLHTPAVSATPASLDLR